MNLHRLKESSRLLNKPEIEIFRESTRIIQGNLLSLWLDRSYNVENVSVNWLLAYENAAWRYNVLFDTIEIDPDFTLSIRVYVHELLHAYSSSRRSWNNSGIIGHVWFSRQKEKRLQQNPKDTLMYDSINEWFTELLTSYLVEQDSWSSKMISSQWPIENLIYKSSVSLTIKLIELVSISLSLSFQEVFEMLLYMYYSGKTSKIRELVWNIDHNTWKSIRDARSNDCDTINSATSITHEQILILTQQ